MINTFHSNKNVKNATPKWVDFVNIFKFKLKNNYIKLVNTLSAY